MNSEEIVQLVMKRILKELDKEKEDTYLLVGKNLVNVNHVQITKDTNDYSNSKGVIVNGFGWENLFRLRNLVTICDNEQLALKTLFENKPIIIIQPNNLSVNKFINAKIEETIRELKLLGFILLKEMDLNNYLQSLNRPRVSEGTTPAFSTKKKLITVDVLRNEYNLEQLTEFKKEPNMIVTALAKDYLRENNIRMI